MASFGINALFNVDSLVAVITGGGSGIGRVIARALATNGAKKVYILGRRSEQLDETAKPYPDIITPLVADVTSKSSLSQAADHIRSETGYINLLVANAGIVSLPMRPRPQDTTGGEDPTADDIQKFLLDTVEDEFLGTYLVNAMGVFYTIAACVTLLDAGNRRGNLTQKSQVISVASVAGQNRRATGGCSYGMSKAAELHLMRQMMTFLVPLGIRANTISPAYFPSSLAGGPPDYSITAEGTFPRELIPLRRSGTDEEMAGTILYLASKAGGYVNGHVLVVDGGHVGYR
ncbi:SDR family NAD(P)-dependent oxidoreductase [Aspergillus lucknowensis]|uniref:Short chain dehydrogenase/reductase family n=1 Tax=Aspergillus lucknowensis TaxID=176173 RepID=A0ABR4M4E9_9EURO